MTLLTVNFNTELHLVLHIHVHVALYSIYICVHVTDHIKLRLFEPLVPLYSETFVLFHSLLISAEWLNCTNLECK